MPKYDTLMTDDTRKVGELVTEKNKSKSSLHFNLKGWESNLLQVERGVFVNQLGSVQVLYKQISRNFDPPPPPL